uniref:Uncharacterized protein n=1 Tax=Streptomyces avermitilis TaxID=33903 RepID=A0A499VET7_STRAX|nr:hypothetical protein SAVMC3_06900 [Streptomyces avermitilis]
MRADERVVTGKIVEDEAEVAIDTAAGTVGKQQCGAAALHDNVEVRRGKRVLSVHAADAKL